MLLLSAAAVSMAQIQGMKAFENRMEGTNVHTNSLQDFTLVALHRSFAAFSPNATLHVRFFLPSVPPSSQREVFVEASELQDSFHYFMQAKNPRKWNYGKWNVFEPWPTKDVIDRLGLRYENIGVRAGYRNASGPPVYVPVDVYQSENQPVSSLYTFYFISGSDLQALDVSVTPSNGIPIKGLALQQKCNKSFNPSCRLYAAGSIHSFPLDMSKLPQGEYHVRLTGHVPGSLIPTSFNLVLYHFH
jgi:hypothetical protein